MRHLKTIYLYLFKWLYPPIYQTHGTAAPITISNLFYQKILRINHKVYWPAHFTSKISDVRKIQIGIGTAPGLSSGCYIQGGGGIELGDYTIVAPNVGIISANHDLHDISKHTLKKVSIGDYCWLGMNSVVLPGVALGDFCIVAAGAVVTKSFSEGYCVIAGNPAKIIKRLEPSLCVKNENRYKYHGFIKAKCFDEYKRAKLDV